MSIKLEAGTNPANSFKINSLEHQRGLYSIIYGEVETDASDNIVEEKVKIGLRDKSTNIILESPQPISSWVNGSDTPYADLDALLTAITSLVLKSGEAFLTQAEYDALTPDEGTVYYIVG